MKPRLLDVFCGAGGAARGYQLAGFHVTGVDIKPQPRYVGDDFVQGDALHAILAVGHLFDAIHASPPCQAFSVGRAIHGRTDHPNLIPATRTLLVATGRPSVIENVPGAPVRADILLCGTMFGLGTGSLALRRHRRFECIAWSPDALAPAACNHAKFTVSVFGHDTLGIAKDKRSRRYRHPNEREYLGVAAAKEALGIDWMTRPELSEAIPPLYTQHIGKQLMRVLVP